MSDDDLYLEYFPDLRYGELFDYKNSDRSHILLGLINTMRYSCLQFSQSRGINKRVAVVFVGKNEFCAYATKQKDTYFIIINSGTVRLLWNLVNILNDTAKRTCRDKFLSSDEVMHSEFCELKHPRDANAVSDWVFKQGCMWVYSHELGHIVNGHVDYLLLHHDRFSVMSCECKALDRRTVEFDADAFAINQTFQACFFTPGADRISHELAEIFGIDDTGADLALAATLHAQLIFAWLDHEWKYEDIALSNYPPSVKRSNYASGTIEAICISRGLNNFAYANTNIAAAVAISVKLRDIFGRQPFPYWRLPVEGGAANHDPVTEILRNWRKLRPILTDLKLTKQELAGIDPNV